MTGGSSDDLFKDEFEVEVVSESEEKIISHTFWTVEDATLYCRTAT